MSIFTFTVTRACTDERRALLEQTLRKGRETAGVDFEWHVYDSGCDQATRNMLKSLQDSGVIDRIQPYNINVGQHVAWNDAFQVAKASHKYFTRVDDDCIFITKRWLKKLYEASNTLDDRFIISPMVRGLKHPPSKSAKLSVKGLDLYFLRDAIGGVCRFHPIALLNHPKHPYIADVRCPMGSGDATGIAKWAKERVIPFVYLNSVRVKHATKIQEARESGTEYFQDHDIFHHIPYIPTRRPIEGDAG